MHWRVVSFQHDKFYAFFLSEIAAVFSFVGIVPMFKHSETSGLYTIWAILPEAVIVAFGRLSQVVVAVDARPFGELGCSAEPKLLPNSAYSKSIHTDSMATGSCDIR